MQQFWPFWQISANYTFSNPGPQFVYRVVTHKRPRIYESCRIKKSHAYTNACNRIVHTNAFNFVTAQFKCFLIQCAIA